MVLGRPVPGFVLDIDATIVLCHSEKEAAAPTWKHTFGYHPLLCFLDSTAKPWPGCCARVTPAVTPPPTTSPRRGLADHHQDPPMAGQLGEQGAQRSLVVG